MQSHLYRILMVIRDKLHEEGEVVFGNYNRGCERRF